MSTTAQRRRRPAARAALAAGVAASLLAACGDQDEDGGETVPAGGTTVLVSEPLDYGMDALNHGRLEDVGGCLGTSGSVVVWPNGTEVMRQEPLTIEVPGYGTFSIGDDVEIGGGYVLEHSSDDVEPGDVEVGGVSVPAECAEHDVFLAS